MPEPIRFITPIREAMGERGIVPNLFRPTSDFAARNIERSARRLTGGRTRRPTLATPDRPNNRAGRRGATFGGPSRPGGRSTGNAGARRLGGASNRGPSRGRGARDTLNRQSTGSGRDRRTGRG